MAKKYEPGDLSEDQIFEKLIRYCDYQERCKFDIHKKFHLLGVADNSQKQKFINKLEESGYLSEKRFVRAFIRGKYQIKKWGIRRIERELKFRKINEELYLELLQDIQDDGYQQQFEDLAIKKWEKIKGKTIYEKKAKLFRFLNGRGYQVEMISEFLKKY